ncbi:hypothetical protein EPR50_G00163920 [Perca flavescens]|uniref:Uncharacterized protein n=1 Tax=Perca flavescens TaxID=8167 RepID=A0A484CH53_PERFV|nr:hypothetical protein EPR50_G00163920 [Perca flavescens]
MDLCEEREDDILPFKVSLSMEHGSQTKADSPVQQETPDSPEPSAVSMKSDCSMAEPLTFRDGNHSTEQRVQQETPDSPEPSAVVNRERSEVTVSHSSDNVHNEADLASIFLLLEENIVTFVKTELKKFHRVLCPDYPECLERQKDDEEMEVDGVKEEQRESSRQSLLKITLHFLRRMKQEELADSLQSSKCLYRFNMIECENGGSI